MINSTCIDCRAPFKYKQRRGRPRIRCFECSPEQRGLKPRPAILKQCRCGEFFQGRSNQKYCTADCRELDRMASCSECGDSVHKSSTSADIQICLPCRRKIALAPKIEVHECERCGEVWQREATKGQRPKYCPDCRGDTRRWIPRHVRFSVYKRDNWVCQICYDPVDSGLIGTMSIWRPSLDHEVPRAAGGSDDPSNLRIAHFWCNGVLNDGRAYCEEDFRTPV